MYTEKISAVGESKTGIIELFKFIIDYIRKFESGRIQDWVNQFLVSIGQKIRLGKFKAN